MTGQTGGSSSSGIKRKIHIEDLVDTVPRIMRRSIEDPAAISAGPSQATGNADSGSTQMDVEEQERNNKRSREGLEYGYDTDIEALDEIQAVMAEIHSMKHGGIYDSLKGEQ